MKRGVKDKEKQGGHRLVAALVAGAALEKEEVDSENISQELRSNLSNPQSPPRKQLKSKVNDKDFVIVCRPKLNRENFPGVS